MRLFCCKEGKRWKEEVEWWRARFRNRELSLTGVVVYWTEPC